MKFYYLLPLLIDFFRQGETLVLDELDNSTHPHLAELIIKLFHDPTVNNKNAQLIFSTHNIHLLSPELLRRDQVWFTEKKKGATSLFSLLEFDKSTVKTDSPYSKGYDEGRFGATPKIDVSAIASILSKGRPENAKTQKKNTKPVKPVLHIFCEGEKTEPNYIRGYLDKYHAGNRRLKIVVIEQTEKNRNPSLLLLYGNPKGAGARTVELGKKNLFPSP